MFIAGIAGAGGAASFLGILLLIFGALILMAILVYTKPARVFRDNNVSPWKAYIPVYNMWIGYVHIGESKLFFWIWFIAAILRFVLLILIQYTDSYMTAFTIASWIGYIPLIKLIGNDESGSFLMSIYYVIVMDMIAIAGAAIPVVLLLNALFYS